MGDPTRSSKEAAIKSEEITARRREYHREWMRKNRQQNPEKQREANARYAAKHGDKIRDAGRKRYAAKREQIIQQVCEYARKNRAKIAARCMRNRLSDPVKHREISRIAYLKYRERDKQLRAQRKPELAAYMRHKRNTDPRFTVADRLRRRINQALSRAGTHKCGKLAETAGCDIATLVRHIENQFLPGMSWGNRREWHLDHIVPLSAFDLTKPDQQKVAFHFANLMPLWASDNLRKHTSIPTGQTQFFWDQSHVERIANKIKKRTALLTAEPRAEMSLRNKPDGGRGGAGLPFPASPPLCSK